MLVLSGLYAQSQTITETFGSGANQFSIDFVEIGNPGNAPDTTGMPNPAGPVGYIYNLGKYEISRDMINKANAIGGLVLTLQDMTSYGGNGGNKPATGITWNEAAKFVNWLNISTGSVAAYKFDGIGNFILWQNGDSGFQSLNPFRNSLARYFLPTRNEWYKGAYGSADGIWYDYATGSNSAPSQVSGGLLLGTSVYGQSGGPADIYDAGGLSPFGTMAQNGNVKEWTENPFDSNPPNPGSASREVRGGAWDSGSSILASTDRGLLMPTMEDRSIGFRIAMVPEPSSLSLLLAGGAVFMPGSRRKG